MRSSSVWSACRAIVAVDCGRSAAASTSWGSTSTPSRSFATRPGERYLHDNGPADVAFARISLAEGLELGKAAGARMSLAHPHTLRSPALVADIYRRHRADGLEGIEALYGRYSHAEREGWLRLARQCDLVVTGGSDFHGEAMPDVAQPGIELPEPYAARVCEWLGVSPSASSFSPMASVSSSSSRS